VAPQHKEVISEVTAYTMEKMMTGCVLFGTGHRFDQYGIKADVGAKTGTTNANVDCWFMSYTPELIIGDWVGADDNFLKMQGDGARIAMPGVGMFMKSILQDPKLGYDPEAKFVKPAVDKNNIISDYIQGYTGPPMPDAEGEDMGNGNASAYEDNSSDSTNAGGYGEDKSTVPPKPDTSKNKSPKAVMPAKPKVEPKKEDNGY
jgi:penicillin-binding protein 1A